MRRLGIPSRFLDWRWLPVYAALVLLLTLARPQPRSLVAGGLLVLAGAALRVWSVGHLVKTDRLTRTGPYAFLRHPLYGGTLLIGLGVLLAAGGPVGAISAAVLLPLFFGYYLPYKERIESARLERLYGDVYRAYRDAVPALLPSGRRWPPPGLGLAAGPPRRWSARRFRASSEGLTLLALVAGFGALCLRALAR